MSQKICLICFVLKYSFTLGVEVKRAYELVVSLPLESIKMQKEESMSLSYILR